MKKWNRGVWAGTLLVIISVVLLNESTSYTYTTKSGPGPGFFPTWLCAILLVLSILYIVESVKNASEPDGEPLPRGESLRKVLYITGSLVFFVVSLSWLGFLLSCMGLLLLLLHKAYKWYINIIVAAVITLILYGLFDRLLGVPLPVNVFGW